MIKTLCIDIDTYIYVYTHTYVLYLFVRYIYLFIYPNALRRCINRVYVLIYYVVRKYMFECIY